MIEISKLNINFKDEIIFSNFSLLIKKGEKVAITGKSGKGKTTLLNLLAGFVPDYKGVVSIFGKSLNAENISEIRKNIAWLPQDTSLAVKTVEELFYAPFEFEINKKNKPGKNEIAEIFKEFELSESLLDKKINEISGGQKQRIMLASCFLLKKSLLLIDEPTSALDEKVKRKITDYILNRKNLTVVAATHDEYWIKKSDKFVELC
ncbi:MAG: ATP-binding cassette domain-containing protein [Bacteroidales bacterium]|nr:ATP-binding cassette domain-containing protein [Bacteroidales bacterium]